MDSGIFRLVIEQTKDYALFVLDPEGRVQTWNQGAERIKGYRADEILGRHFSTFYTREAIDAGWPHHELRMATMDGRFEDEGWRVRKDGSRFWANVVLTALRDKEGQLLGFSKITRDLTERKMQEETTRQSEERFRLLVEGVVDYAIFSLDPDGFVSSWNTGAQRLKGYKRDEIVGKHFSRFYGPDDIAAGKPWAELAAARRDGRVEDEGWRVRKDGSRFWARVVVSVLHDDAGRLRGFAKVTQDLTERRHIQDLENAARNVSEFVAMLAHELRNPLAPIRNAVHAMAHLPVGSANHEAMRETIDRQSAALSRIVDDLIDINRITRGTLAVEHTKVDLADVVMRAVETAEPAIKARDHTLQIDVSRGELMVIGDRDRLTQAVGNLLNNAARYTPAGGTITVTGQLDASSVRLMVADTGRGIEPDLIGRIFDMFVQGRQPIERVGGGLGIGLALSRKLLELHGGTLEASSEGANKGSTFTLRLARADLTEIAANPPVKPSAVFESPAFTQSVSVQRSTGESAHASMPKRVLVVDDNEDAAGALELLLQSLGHETCVVHSGIEALEMVVKFRPDLILLDIGMPGMDGYEVARRLQDLKQRQVFRVVAVTGWGQESDREKSRQAGFDLHLVKPVDTEDLINVLSQRGEATLH